MYIYIYIYIHQGRIEGASSTRNLKQMRMEKRGEGKEKLGSKIICFPLFKV